MLALVFGMFASGDLLASATVPAGTTGNLTADFRYVPIDDGRQLTLEPNVTYCLGAHVTKGGNVFGDNYQETKYPSHFFVRHGESAQNVNGSVFATGEFSMPTLEGPKRSEDQVRWFIGPNAALIETFVNKDAE